MTYDLDESDSKSAEVHPSWGFDPPSRHQVNSSRSNHFTALLQRPRARTPKPFLSNRGRNRGCSRLGHAQVSRRRLADRQRSRSHSGGTSPEFSSRQSTSQRSPAPLQHV